MPLCPVRTVTLKIILEKIILDGGGARIFQKNAIKESENTKVCM
jgi:hypothetical protein